MKTKLYIAERKNGGIIEVEANSFKEAKSEIARYANAKISTTKLLGKKSEFLR